MEVENCGRGIYRIGEGWGKNLNYFFLVVWRNFRKYFRFLKILKKFVFNKRI